MQISRRSFFLGAGALVAAPSIVRASSLMPVKFVPEPWLVCDGRAVLKAQYPDLFRVLGNMYGGDHGKTFNLPDMRGMLYSEDFARNPGRAIEYVVSTTDTPMSPTGFVFPIGFYSTRLQS